MDAREFIIDYAAVLAALVTVAGALLSARRWLSRKLVSWFGPRRIGALIENRVSCPDVEAGLSHLLREAKLFDPDELVGVNRGGAIIGGMLGKHLERLVRVIEVWPETESVFFLRSTGDLQGKKILLVDDRRVTGRSLELAQTFLVKQGAQVLSLVFVDVENPVKRAVLNGSAYRAASYRVPFPWDLLGKPNRGWKTVE